MESPRPLLSSVVQAQPRSRRVWTVGTLNDGHVGILRDLSWPGTTDEPVIAMGTSRSLAVA